MDLQLDGKVALVAGASAGMGKAIAASLASEGARVAVSSRSRERIEAAAAEIGARAFVHDNINLAAAPELIAAVERELGPIDVLALSSGGPPADPDPLRQGEELWRRAYDDYVLGPMALVRAAVPGMRARGFGRIVNVSSTAVREPIPDIVLSTVHRSGALAAFKAIARDVAADGVTLNTLLVGRAGTDALYKLYGSVEATREAVEAEVPARRLASLEEIGAVAAFLCSVPAGYVTGAALPVDGGLLLSI